MCFCSPRYDVARIKICASSSTTRMTAMAWRRSGHARLPDWQAISAPAKSWPATEPALADQSYEYDLNVSLGALLRAELYEAQIKAIDILPRGPLGLR